MTLQDTKSWAEVAIGLDNRLTRRGAEIVHEYQELELLSPSSESPEARHAGWRANGAMKIRTHDNVQA